MREQYFRHSPIRYNQPFHCHRFASPWCPLYIHRGCRNKDKALLIYFKPWPVCLLVRKTNVQISTCTCFRGLYNSARTWGGSMRLKLKGQELSRRGGGHASRQPHVYYWMYQRGMDYIFWKEEVGMCHGYWWPNDLGLHVMLFHLYPYWHCVLLILVTCLQIKIKWGELVYFFCQIESFDEGNRKHTKIYNSLVST